MLDFISNAAKILFKDPFTQKIGKIEVLLVTNREIVMQSEMTKNPIEDGSLISDHIIDQPLQIPISAKISDFSTKNSILSSALRAENPFSFGANKLGDVYNELVSIKEKKIPIDLVLPEATFEKMVMTNLRFLSQVGTAKVLIFECLFEKANIVTSSVVTITNEKIRGDRAKAKTNFGNQVAETTPAPKSTITLGQFFKGLFE